MSDNYSDFRKSQQTNPTLKPKRVSEYRKIWLQLKNSGYDVIPLGAGKDKPPFGWPTLSNTPDDIAKWNGKAAGVRMYGGQLVFFDLDVLRADLRDAMLAMVKIRWPAFLEECLKRHSGQVKLGLIGRVKSDKRYLSTLRYLDADGTSHKVEVFTPASKRYVAVHGVHSPGREYGYEGHSILDVCVDELPWFPAEDLGALVDACDAIMREHGLTPVLPAYGKTDKPVAYDIGDLTRFDVHEGPDQIDYDALVNLFHERGDELRVSSSFSNGGTNRGKCRVGHCQIARCIGVYDNEAAIWHCPADTAPEAIIAGIAEPLRKLAEELGVTLQPPVPNWRERYIGNGRPKGSFNNAKDAIEAIGLNCFHDDFHIRITLLAHPNTVGADLAGDVSEAVIARLQLRISNTYGFDPTKQHVYDAIVALAHEHAFDPVAEMMDKAEEDWDGRARLDRMAADFLSCEDTPFTAAAVRKFMIAAVARVRHPGCKFDQIPVLEAPEGWNKSTALAVLAGEGNFSDASIIGASGREVQEHLGGVLIHEIPDLAGMRKAEVEAVKAFASRTNDRARPAYGRVLVDQPRRGVIAGTTNGNRYLQSQTGNRRFWPLPLVRPIDIEQLATVRLQLWGEAARRQKAGESLILPNELWETAREEQEERRAIHPWEAKLEGLALRPPGAQFPEGQRGLKIVQQTPQFKFVATSDIFEEALRMPGWRQNRTDTGTLADVMRILGWEACRPMIEGTRMRGYLKR